MAFWLIPVAGLFYAAYKNEQTRRAASTPLSAKQYYINLFDNYKQQLLASTSQKSYKTGELQNMPKSLQDQAKPILDLIGAKESNNNYNVIYGGKTINLTSMAIGDVLNYQRQLINSGYPSSAVGKYQFINKTLAGLVKELNIPLTERFSPALQDRLATQLLQRRGLIDFIKGNIAESTFIRRISQEWASFPKDKTNKSYYDGDGLNKALVSYNQVADTVRLVRVA